MAKFPGSTKSVRANKATLPERRNLGGQRGRASDRDRAAAVHRQAPYSPKPFPKQI